MSVTAIRTKDQPTITAIAAAWGAGALDGGCKDGPAAFRRHWERSSHARQVPLAWEWLPGEALAVGAAPLQAVVQGGHWLAGVAERVTVCGSRPLAIGGDHSCAIGTWSGVARAMRHRGPLGLIWIDAHMDMHVPETTHSGAINGMPLAALLGHGAAELTAMAGDRPALEPHRVCLIGARSFEPEEVEFARRHGVRVIDSDELGRRGLDAALDEARAIAMRDSCGFGVSLDLDAFDPVDAPGVGTPVGGGIRAGAFLDAWTDLTQTPACRAIEIVEYNPRRDRAGRTAALMTALVSSATGTARLRWAG
ncbi:MAG: arginase family protein [Hyphomicrobiales bacterium]|nr:arginase family protein [Hyphomicrobiales bacterium]